MIDPIAVRPFDAPDLMRLDPQPAQADWRDECTPELAAAMADSATMFTWTRGDDVLAVGGIAAMPRGPMVLVVLSEAARRCRKTIVRDTMIFLSAAARAGFDRVWTHTDAGNRDQARLVGWLGFRKTGNEVVAGRHMDIWERS